METIKTESPDLLLINDLFVPHHYYYCCCCDLLFLLFLTFQTTIWGKELLGSPGQSNTARDCIDSDFSSFQDKL